ncbi:hypothetical protein EJB05_46139 [Eragrostis curvula]|uniref:Uncharacterized protein n=1 Tax=Eragrostis curvula TaxID=38414 RepID=A0A5J9TM63_9POAL|nr:hypothetical protein EJB05_46139 [Eragrostis curvula]
MEAIEELLFQLSGSAPGRVSPRRRRALRRPSSRRPTTFLNAVAFGPAWEDNNMEVPNAGRVEHIHGEIQRSVIWTGQSRYDPEQLPLELVGQNGLHCRGAVQRNLLSMCHELHRIDVCVRRS